MPSKTLPGDVTGAKRLQLQKEQEEAAKARQEELTMIHAAETEAVETEVIDVTQNVPVVVVDPEEVLTVEDEHETIRVAEDLQQVTVGRETYNFVAGRKYRVPRNVAFVLRTAGKVYDRA